MVPGVNQLKFSGSVIVRSRSKITVFSRATDCALAMVPARARAEAVRKSFFIVFLLGYAASQPLGAPR